MKRRLAKLAALLTVLVLLPVCALPETANTPEDQTNIIIEEKTFPHLWCYNKKDGGKVSEGEMNLYFMDGGGHSLCRAVRVYGFPVEAVQRSKKG